MPIIGMFLLDRIPMVESQNVVTFISLEAGNINFHAQLKFFLKFVMKTDL
jgi:hypothetical protein